MAKDRFPVTNAIRALRAAGLEYEPFTYPYRERGGTAASAEALGVHERCVIKTLVMQDETQSPLIVLMHGDREVSTKALARLLGVKDVQPCRPEVADRHSGYQVGGTSPFGTRRSMPIYAQRTIVELPAIWLNGGKRGFLVRLDPDRALAALSAQLVDVEA